MILSDMARLSRFELGGIPQRVVQGGDHRLPCLLDDEDCQRYLHGYSMGRALQGLLGGLGATHETGTEKVHRSFQGFHVVCNILYVLGAQRLRIQARHDAFRFPNARFDIGCFVAV